MPRRQGLTGRRVSIVAAAKHRINRLNETQEEKDERLRLQREYSRRRRALETEEDRAQRLALDSQRRKRKQEKAMRLQRKLEGQNLPLRKGTTTTRGPKSGSTGVLAGRFITRPPGGILEPEITLVKSYSPGFMKFMMSIHDEAITPNSSVTGNEHTELGLSQGISPFAAGVEDCSKSPVSVQVCDDFKNTLIKKSNG